ncbi:ORF6N domain-containing protein [Pelagibacterium sediminicola]|uniref:ORF6N domain-containing protein n=1 Tax=Pelagibacterium sediminicola TaxID=2248761 RepID=UPI0013007089|nr:ORF6N domain-containing protein [Pelagibacterium sediminicola]
MPSLPIVAIAGTEIHQITYKGEPVVTFGMVDEVHQRADGTASRNFRENRQRFVEGEDFIELTSDEIRRMSDAGAFPARTARGTILTRRGYLKLVKPMNDDRAWEVQGEMIDRYFLVEQIAEAVTSRPRISSDLRETRQTFLEAARIAKIAGLTGNAAILSAADATKRLLGTDPLEIVGRTHLPAPTNDAMVNPTMIGKELGVSAHMVNIHLEACGYQDVFRDDKNKLIYQPTAKGSEAGGRLVDTGKKSGGRMVQQLLWPTSIIERLRAEAFTPA